MERRDKFGMSINTRAHALHAFLSVHNYELLDVGEVCKAKVLPANSVPCDRSVCCETQLTHEERRSRSASVRQQVAKS